MADRDQQDIIDTIIAEAYGEGSEGMRRVAETILNRSDIRGITPGEVVRQPDQYTGYWSPGPAAREAQRQQEARDAAWAAYELAQQPGDPTQGADHYFNPNIVQPSWARAMTPTGQYGGHAYYRSTNARAPANTAQAPTPQTIGPGAIAQRNRVTPQIPAWASMGMNQPPAVQSGALSPAQQATARRLALQMQTPSYAGIERGQSTGWNAAAAAGARQPSAFGAFEQGGRPPGGYVAQPAGSINPNKNQERIAAGQPLEPVQVASNPNAVNPLMPSEGLQAARMGRPIPFQRPNFGIGGPGFAPVNAAAMAQARPPLNILVEGARTIQPPVAMQRFAPPPPPRPEVGTMLGMATNGGQMMQGYNGVMNSITQGNSAFRAALGDSSASGYRSGGDNDKNPSIGGYFKGR